MNRERDIPYKANIISYQIMLECKILIVSLLSILSKELKVISIIYYVSLSLECYKYVAITRYK